MLRAAFNVFSITVLALVAAVLVIPKNASTSTKLTKRLNGRCFSTSSACSRSGRRWKQPVPLIFSRGGDRRLRPIRPRRHSVGHVFRPPCPDKTDQQHAVAAGLDTDRVRNRGCDGRGCATLHDRADVWLQRQFLDPDRYQTNTYVFGAGGYKFTDFPRIRVPLNLIFWLTASVLIPIFWPFVAAH